MFKKLSFLLFLFFCSTLVAQKNTRIELIFSNKSLLVGDNFSIVAVVYNPKSGNSPTFPAIKGFDKQNISQGQQTSIVNGKVTSFFKFEQNYTSLTPGNFRLPAFTLQAGGAKVSHKGFNIKVKKIPGFEDDTFLELKAVKKDVFIGEPFQLELSIWYSKENAKKMQFGNHTTQKIDELKKYFASKPIWIEYISETGLGSRQLTNGKVVYGTRVMTMIVIPQSSGTLHFDPVDVDMIKSISGYGRVEKRYISKPLDVRVKALPYHSTIKDPVIGSYVLIDKASSLNLKTGDEAIYTFEIQGEGNLPFLEGPRFIENDSLLIVKSDENLEMNTKNQTIKGKKSFTYSLIPQAPGVYDLSKYFTMEIFDFKTNKYKVINGNKILKVTGESFLGKQTVQTSTTLGELKKFEPLLNQNDEMVSIHTTEKLNIITNVLLLLIMIALIFLILRGSKNKNITEL